MAAAPVDSISIAGRFNGPLDSGNGGYSAGMLAGALGGGPAEVSLRSPVPLDRPLALRRAGDGELRALDGEQLIAEARPAPEFALDVPEPVGVEAAREAMAAYRGSDEGPFSRCFVCGLGRPDSFEVFAGKVEGRELLASTWTPPAWTAGPDGFVRPEIVWAALDCPASYAAYIDAQSAVALLARITARVDRPVAAGAEHVVIAWPLGGEGRKREAGSAVVSARGETLARARALLIEPRPG